MAFPPDACSLIVNYVADSRPTLVALCTVSKQFQIPAEKALYNTLHLQGYENTVAVCRVLASTPRVAMLVVALSVHGQEEGSDSEAEEFEPSDDYWVLLRDALRRTTRLRFLNLYFSGGGETDKAWVLDGCSFQLRTFHCDFTWDRHLAAFLSTQSRLGDLYLADFREPEAEAGTHADAMVLDLPISASSILTSAFLPKLSILECTFSEAAVALVPERPIARVKTCFTHSKHEEKCVELRAIVGALRRSKKRLRALDIADSSYTADFSLELLSSLTADAFFCGDLRYLGTLVFPVDGRKRLEFYAFLMRMPQLRCVEVDVSDWDPPPTHAAALRALTCELRLYCPSITTVVFVYDFERYLVKVVGGLAVYDEDAVTENLWREI
ncbi:hypothetical protein L227DRAFT_508145 [Lentinus tigrinus ALCF2SS1-6]|uniref:F-box domain-containing protein n=2 Tax=Lentinus tigrinus TaxID=5365 RepID=A0A5C2S001_9APHY|nr:hypothetical protein L227DRAFT_508145 [Lentinus tigrinus ALCF2SS1-6]